MSDDDEPVARPSLPQQNYYEVSLGDDVGFTYITSVEWDAEDLDKFMRGSCDIILQAHRHKLLIDALAGGSLIKVKNLLAYGSEAKLDDFEVVDGGEEDKPKGYQ